MDGAREDKMTVLYLTICGVLLLPTLMFALAVVCACINSGDIDDDLNERDL